MGDPKFSRRKYVRPSSPWEAERIKLENELLKKYGLKNKKELWRTQSILRRFRQRARILQALIRAGNKQAVKEKDELITRLGKMGLLPLEGATLDDVLSLDVEAVLSRRLQTLTFVKGLSFTPRQARQFIIHGHVAVGGRTVKVPGYIVGREEEYNVSYATRSPLSNDLHPVRVAASAAERGLVEEGGEESPAKGE